MKNKGYPSRKGWIEKIEPQKKGEQVRFIPYEKHRHYSTDLEQSVLGVCLLRPDNVARVVRLLKPEMFYSDFHKSVFNSISAMWDAGTAIDLNTVVDYMYNHPDPFIEVQLKAGINVGYEVIVLTNYVVSDTHLTTWAARIMQMYIKRKLLEITSGGSREDNTNNELERIQNEVHNLFQLGGDKAEWTNMADLAVQMWQHIALYEGAEMIGLPSGFRFFDKVTSGITPGLYYLGARPSVGKTAFILKMILNIAQAGDPVGLISLETKGLKLNIRMASMISGEPYWRIWRSRLTPEGKKNLFEYSAILAKLPIYVHDDPNTTLTDIKAKSWNLFKQGAKIIFIDYLQLITPDEGAGTREQEVAKISRGLKLLSMELNIPIIALAQLSRESERRQDRTPKLVDLRESGSLEQDADGVMLLHRPEVGAKMDDPLIDEDGNSVRGKGSLIVSKWRDGATLEIPLLFNGERMEFSEDEEMINSKATHRPAPSLAKLPSEFRDITQSNRENGGDEDYF